MTTPQELISKYFDKSISALEEAALFKILENNKELRDEFELEKDLQIALISKKKDDLKTLLKEAEINNGRVQSSQISEENSNIKKSFNFKILIAALLILAVGTTLFFTFFSTSMSNEELFVKNFEPYRNIIAPITRGDKEKTPEEIAFANYEQKNYNKAMLQFENLYRTTPNPYYLFYQGNTMLQMGNIEVAISKLKLHQTYKDDFYQKSRWYLALAYLNTENTEKAIPLFTELVSAKGFEWKRAKNILKKIKE